MLGIIVVVADHDKIQTQQSTKYAEENKYERMRMVGGGGKHHHNNTTIIQSGENAILLCWLCGLVYSVIY